MLDLAFDEENAKLASEVRSFLSLRPINILTPLEAWKEGKIVSAVCHGPAYANPIFSLGYVLNPSLLTGRW